MGYSVKFWVFQPGDKAVLEKNKIYNCATRETEIIKKKEIVTIDSAYIADIASLAVGDIELVQFRMEGREELFQTEYSSLSDPNQEDL